MPVSHPSHLTDLRAQLGELSPGLFGSVFVASVQAVENYGVEWAIELVHQLAIAEVLGREATTPEDLIEELSLAPAFAPALHWLLRRLKDAGHLVSIENPGDPALQTGAAPSPLYSLPRPLRPAAVAALRAQALALAPSNAAALDLLDAAGESYPKVARGEVSGQQALLGPHRVALWARYFHNDNPIYAINNIIAATAVANRLPAAQGRILEVGAGGGSGARALLDRLDQQGHLASLASYRITEPSPFFRRRAQRELTAAYPQQPLAFAELDIDKPWQDQGIEAESVDLIFGVNVIHVAHDLAWSLGEALRSLAPGGWLIAEECVRPQPGQAISTEMVFQLLDSFTKVKLDPETRPNPGFLTVPQWRGALHKAGFARVEVVPDLEAITDSFPLFFSGALCAQKAS